MRKRLPVPFTLRVRSLIHFVFTTMRPGWVVTSIGEKSAGQAKYNRKQPAVRHAARMNKRWGRPVSIHWGWYGKPFIGRSK